MQYSRRKKISVSGCGQWGLGRSEAFTLVELMMVVAVIGVIAGIVLAAAGGVQKKAARDQARAEIKMFGVALERYRANTGEYPQSTNPARNILFASLTNFMNFNSNNLSGSGTNTLVLDPYGNPYWYRSPARVNTTMARDSFEIWSVGANGRSGLTNGAPNLSDTNNVDDITSWQ